MSHHNHSKRRKYNHNNTNRPRWRNNNNYNHNHNNQSAPHRQWRGRGRGGNRARMRGRGNYHNRQSKRTTSFNPYQDISRMKLDNFDNTFPYHNDRYAPGGSEYERGGTATPASMRYMQYQSYSAGPSPVYGLSQHESPSMESYKQIEDEYKAYLHELNVDESYPRLTYRVREESDKKDVIHFGQLKLLLSEIRFLTEYCEHGKVIVYAGAAPGHHIKYLSDLFPSHRFELYDPCAFSEHLDNHSKITCHQEYFTNKLAKELGEEYKDEGILFISDIRTADHRQMEEMENEECITRDNEWQKEWCQAMQPRKAMLKFRLPYPDRIEGPTEYMDGQIWLQSFARRSGTETRLIPIEGDDCRYSTMKMYDHKQFEENLFFFNERVRKVYVDNEFYDSSIGFENSFDCWSYGYLLERYLFYVVGMDVDETEDVFKKKKVLHMVQEISESLNMKSNWLRYRQNKKSDYIENYDQMDHRHFHDLNQEQVKAAIPLPHKVKAAARKNRKRSYHEYANDDGATATLESLRYIAPRTMDAEVIDPIGFIKRIAKPFPNPDAWNDKIIQMIGDKKAVFVEGDDVIDLLFKYLDVKSEDERQNEREDRDIAKGTQEELNHIPALLCINRLFAVLCIQIPPCSGLLNDSKVKNAYVMYGLCDASKITTAILSKETNELYLFGILSHEQQITFKLVKIVGINQAFVAMDHDDAATKENIRHKLLSIDANLRFSK